jgi:hypothetical protein
MFKFFFSRTVAIETGCKEHTSPKSSDKMASNLANFSKSYFCYFWQVKSSVGTVFLMK